MRRCASALLAAVAVVCVAGAARGAAPGPPSPPAGAELAALSQPAMPPPLASQRIYFVMTDRYANGDPANDRGGLTGPRAVTGYDATDEGYYHGGDLKGLTGDCADPKQGLARIKALGFNSIWITPPFRQKYVQGDSAAYHGYWILDMTQVDPHLGTNADFGAFVDCADRLGVKVILDVVVNHTADVIQLAGGTSYTSKPFRDCRGKLFSPARYVTAAKFPCLKASNMPRAPFVSPGERNAKAPPFLNNPLNYHDRGDIDFGSCSPACFEQGDFFGLDDLFTEKPAVMNGLAQVYGDWVRRYKLDGFRIDTARHVNAAFFRLWAPKIMAAAKSAGVPDFQMFGEVAITDSVELSRYVRDRGLPNVLDFPLQDALARYAGGSAGPGGIVSRLEDDDYFETPSGQQPAPATFLGNHDMGRAAFQVKEQVPGAGPDELLARVLLGHTVLYLLRGAPVEYYGDEVGMIGTGGDKQARQDMFPTHVEAWQTQDRLGAPPIGTGSSFDVTGNPIEERLRLLNRLRDENPALATGATIVRLSQGSVLAFSRIDATAKREYLAFFNAGKSAAHVVVPTATPSSGWTALLGDVTASSDGSGSVALDVPALSSVLLRADVPIPDAAATSPSLTVGPDTLSDLWFASVAAPKLPVSVTFAIRRAGAKTWQRLGSDDSPPYRAPIDPAKLKRGEKIYVVAVARALDGSSAVSKIVGATPRKR